MDSKEKDLRLCKVCGEIKVRILDGRYPNKNKKFSDQDGKLWSGNRCPACVVQASRERMRLKRAK